MLADAGLGVLLAPGVAPLDLKAAQALQAVDLAENQLVLVQLELVPLQGGL